MKLISIANYDNKIERLTYEEALRAAYDKGCRLLTREEIQNMPITEWGNYVCFWIEGGFAAGGKIRISDVQPPIRLGVVGVRE